MYAWTPEDLPVFYEDFAFESEATQNWKVICGLPMFGYPSTIPYGALVAKGIGNLLVPSKHFGVAHDLGGGLRMQAEMRKTGLVAACAAKVMLERNCPARFVPYANLRPLLEAAGTLDMPGKTRVTTYAGHEYEPFSEDEVVSALGIGISRTSEWWQGDSGACTDSPNDRAAFALWTCWDVALKGTLNVRQSLAECLFAKVQERGRYSGNYAVALGLMGDSRAMPMLREMVASPGGEVDPAVKGAYPNRIKAILLLGRFADAEIAQTLRKIVLDNADAFMKDLYGHGAWSTPEMCRFQALSYALMALKSILARHPEATLAKELSDWQANHASAFVQPDGIDLRERLRHVEFNS